MRTTDTQTPACKDADSLPLFTPTADKPMGPGDKAVYPMVFDIDDHDRPFPGKDVTPETIDWDKAIEAVQDTISLISNRYELHEGADKVMPNGRKFMMSASNMKAKTWDMIKYKMALKMVDPEYKKYLMIFGGSSVTAGHDGYYNQAYSSIAMRTLQPVMDLIGIELQVHNIAQTANGCIPYDLCYEAMGGLDADLVNWEQSYNCGHDNSAFELTARWAGWSKHRGIVYYSASGAWAPNNCPSETQPARSLEEWTPAVEKLKPWKPTQADLDKEREDFDMYAKAHDSNSRFAPFANEKAYVGLGVIGFNVWEGNPKIEYDGKTNKAAADIGNKCGNMKFMTNEAGVYGSGKGARWHPTRGFHMLRGEFLAYDHLMPMLDAMYMVKKELDNGAKSKTLADTYKAKVDELMPPMGLPKYCGNYHCADKPTCFTNFYPHFPTNMTLTELVVGRNEWRMDGYMPTDSWHGKYGLRDLKPELKAQPKRPSGGDLHLKVNIDNTNYAWICGSQLDSSLYFLEVDGQKRITKSKDGIHEDFEGSPTRTQIDSTKLTDKDTCFHIADLPKGKHIISISLDYAKTGVKPTAINNVIMWP